MITASTVLSLAGLSDPQGPWGHVPRQFLADSLALYQPGGQIMPTILLRALPDFQTYLRPCSNVCHRLGKAFIPMAQ